MLDFRYFDLLLCDLKRCCEQSSIDFEISQISVDDILKEVVITFSCDKLHSLKVLELVYELGHPLDDSIVYNYDPEIVLSSDIIKARFPFENIEFVYEKIFSHISLY